MVAGVARCCRMDVILTAAERKGLRAAMKREASARLYRRLQAVWLAAEGHSATQVAAITGSSVRSVQGWCAAWRRSKVRRQPQQALAEKPRLGRHPVVPALNRARLLAEVARDPLALGYAATNWTVPLLAAHLRGQGPSDHRAHPAPPPARRRAALEASALRLCRTRPAHGPEKRALVRAMKRLPPGGRLLVLDETTLRHLPPLRAAWAPRGKQAAVRISGTNARRSLFGALDLRTGRRVSLVRRHQRLADYHAFLRRLRHGRGSLRGALAAPGSARQPPKSEQPAPGRKARHPFVLVAAPAPQAQPGRSSLARVEEPLCRQPPVRQHR